MFYNSKMPFESRHKRFGFPTDKWNRVPQGRTVAHEPSYSTSRLKTHTPGTFLTEVETIVSADQSRLVIVVENMVRTSLFSYEKQRENKVIGESDRKISIKTGTLGRRMQFRPTK